LAAVINRTSVFTVNVGLTSPVLDICVLVAQKMIRADMYVAILGMKVAGNSRVREAHWNGCPTAVPVAGTGCRNA
jgi:hypothetical protein